MTDFIVFVFFGCVVNMVNLFFLAMSVWGDRPSVAARNSMKR